MGWPMGGAPRVTSSLSLKEQKRKHFMKSVSISDQYRKRDLMELLVKMIPRVKLYLRFLWKGKSLFTGIMGFCRHSLRVVVLT